MIAMLVCTVVVGQAAPSAFEPAQFPVAPAVMPEPRLATHHAFLLHFDKDRNGVLTLEEIPEPLRRKFDRADLNRDGKLDARELLVGPTKISREARKIEDLHVTRQGLTKKGPTGAEQQVLFRVGTEILHRLDRNGDGYADASELGTILQQPGVLFGDARNAAAAAVAEAGTQSFGPGSSPNSSAALATPSPFAVMPPAGGIGNPAVAPSVDRGTPVASRSTTPISSPSAAAPPNPGPVAPTAAGSAPLPDAATILKHLDKNGNGQLDRDEAVDQLADNFQRLDKNRDNMLSEQEIKRGLLLARMFGIKPKQDPLTYKTMD